ncbi:hypothetical protein BG006_002763 [Podila minutissima]|uniref:Uncharacterized protein n=1 Tax=Podila minutissima TaxID=64525 RepID=A0A9P5SS21_9FUNG|nr:hypothetical protein BG006_002763 [Podila minutissima]
MTIAMVPRDRTKDPISAPMVTCYNVKSLIDSPQFCQRAILPSGRTVSYTTCGSRTGSLVLYFYGLGGSCRQLAIMHAQAVRLDIKLLCIDRPGTGYTEPFTPKSKSKLNLFSRSSKAWSKSSSPSSTPSSSSPSSSTALSSASSSNGSSPTSSTASEFSTNLRARSTSSLPITKRRSENGVNAHGIFGAGREKMSCFDLSRPERDIIAEESEPDGDEEEEEEGDNANRKGYWTEDMYSSKDSHQGTVLLNHNVVAHGPGADKGQSKQKQKQKKPTLAAQRIDYVCQEALELVDTLLSRETKFGMMGHSCGIYYIMRMLQKHSDRILDGPIALLTPWVPFNECPETTSKSFKFLRHVPRGVVWAVTSSMNHIGSVILSSSSALSTTFAKQDDTGEKDRPSTDPFVLQFSDAVDKIVLPALVQDMNRQNSSGYNCEIQMCISDIGYDLAAIPIPTRVRVHAYCGYLDDMVPLEASREMGARCGWKMHEFQYSSHGGPRIFMTALEDYAIARTMLKHGLN